MASKIFDIPKGIKEEKYTSISKHNALVGSDIILFDPPNISSFECKMGRKDNKDIYIKEKLVCMWGNDEIEEYVLLDEEYKAYFVLPSMDKINKYKQEYVKAKVGDTIIEYSHRNGRFSRFLYNVWFEYNSRHYYLYIKTCDGRKFKKLMEEFILKAIS